MEERIERVLKMLMDRADYHHDHFLQYHDDASSAAMTAYHSAYMMLYYAQQGYDDLLNQFDYYEEEKINDN